MLDNNKVLTLLRKVINPNTSKNIVEDGKMFDFQVKDNRVTFTIVLHPSEDNLKMLYSAEAEKVVQEAYPEAQVLINFKKQQQAATSPLPQVKHVIAIASGKGGVGKSTVSSNLAIALSQKGYKVGLMDADLYGPSMPTMLGLKDSKPQIRKVAEKAKMIPIEQYGIHTISLGYLIEEEQAVVLRGPRLAGIIKQFIYDTLWPELDFMIIDLPPGTGDIQLTLVQSLPLTGAVMVTTPQQVSVADAHKAMNMFRLPNVNVPILGVIENMSWFTPEELPDNRYELFGSGGGERLAQLGETKLLGQVPLVMGVGSGADQGKPAMIQDANVAKAYLENATDAFLGQLAIRQKDLPETQMVKITVT
jgi:ATP-binding protein involved in chromosome partitioning